MNEGTLARQTNRENPLDRHNTGGFLSHLKHVVFGFHVNPRVATASLTHFNGAMCQLLAMASLDMFVHSCDVWMIGTSYLTCSNTYLSVPV